MSAAEISPPLILTAKLDPLSQAWFDALRERHFPPERNLIPAHLSLFHRLPGELEHALRKDLREECAAQSEIPASVTGLRFLGKGVAYTLESPGLQRLHANLSGRWKPHLAAQDLQRLSPHVTVQNKSPPRTAKTLYARLASTFEPAPVNVQGVSLWSYLRGPWQHLEDFAFEKINA